MLAYLRSRWKRSLYSFIVNQLTSCGSTRHYSCRQQLFLPVFATHVIFVASIIVVSVELPVVEKLQLSELTGSSVEEQDESVDEDELLRFRELKEMMITLDKAELGSVSQCNRNPKSRLLPVNKR